MPAKFAIMDAAQRRNLGALELSDPPDSAALGEIFVVRAGGTPALRNLRTWL